MRPCDPLGIYRHSAAHISLYVRARTHSYHGLGTYRLDSLHVPRWVWDGLSDYCDCSERPRRRRAANESDERAALHLRGHSITSSARASSVGGRSRPSAVAVLRLITNSNFVGYWTGKSEGSFILNLPSHHSITSSARASSVGGISRPNALAVLRLITSSNFVGCITGKSAGLVPFKILPT
jgi:hypothetical protein